MQTIKSLEGHRWFIWTLVFLLVSGVALVSYISFTDVDSVEAWPNTTKKNATPQPAAKLEVR